MSHTSPLLGYTAQLISGLSSDPAESSRGSTSAGEQQLTPTATSCVDLLATFTASVNGLPSDMHLSSWQKAWATLKHNCEQSVNTNYTDQQQHLPYKKRRSRLWSSGTLWAAPPGPPPLWYSGSSQKQWDQLLLLQSSRSEAGAKLLAPLKRERHFILQ